MTLAAVRLALVSANCDQVERLLLLWLTARTGTAQRETLGSGVTVTITATVVPVPGATISNQGTIVV